MLISSHGQSLSRTRLAMKIANERRVEELKQLKVALATFALQLDAFEMRTHEVLLAAGRPLTKDPLVDGGRADHEKRGPFER
jgi:hypothetical protein